MSAKDTQPPRKGRFRLTSPWFWVDTLQRVAYGLFTVSAVGGLGLASKTFITGVVAYVCAFVLGMIIPEAPT